MYHSTKRTNRRSKLTLYQPKKEMWNQWNQNMELTVVTPMGETVKLDIPSMLHDEGLLHKLTHDGSTRLKVNKTTGTYTGVSETATGYSALSGSITTPSARYTAQLRGAEMSRRRRLSPIHPRPTSAQSSQRPVPSLTYATSTQFPIVTAVPLSAYFPLPPIPTSPVSDSECEFVMERTREERDEEGRANAISLTHD